MLVGINLFSPDTAKDVVAKVSDTTGVDKELINDNLNKATNVVKENIK